MMESAMNTAQRLSLSILAGACCLLLQSCATVPGAGAEGWKQLAAAADAQTTRPVTPGLQFAWETPKMRLLVLASQGEDQQLLYQVDPAAGHSPAEPKRIRCHFDREQLVCAGPGQAAAAPVGAPGAEPVAVLQAHAAAQMQKLDAASRDLLQAQLARQPEPRFDIMKQRHPFEWGGEHETIENAQAFLEVLTARGTPFRSGWPRAPWLGSQGNGWENENDVVTLKTVERCMMLASSANRTVIHYNHDFWASDTVSFKTVYRWQQPIDLRRIATLRMEKDGVFVHGTWDKPFQGQGLAYVSGWSPDILTANATRFDPSKYSVAEWNMNLVLPAAAGLRERALYALTYLDIMCKKS